MSDFNTQTDAEAVAIKAWIAGRIEAIHRVVSAHDVLQRFGVRLRYGSNREEQISCPFHGKDTKPSARVYPDSAKGPSGVYCYVCLEQWDAIRLWKKFTNFEGGFTSLLREIETAYHIEIPESPREYRGKHVEDTSEVDEIYDLMDTCDRRLRNGRIAFDRDSYYRVIVALDRIRHQFDHKQMGIAQAKSLLTVILEKIATRVRACPEG